MIDEFVSARVRMPTPKLAAHRAVAEQEMVGFEKTERGSARTRTLTPTHPTFLRSSVASPARGDTCGCEKVHGAMQRSRKDAAIWRPKTLCWRVRREKPGTGGRQTVRCQPPKRALPWSMRGGPGTGLMRASADGPARLIQRQRGQSDAPVKAHRARRASGVREGKCRNRAITPEHRRPLIRCHHLPRRHLPLQH